MSALTGFNRTILAGSTALLTADIVDENEDAIASSDLSTITLVKLYDIASGATIASEVDLSSFVSSAGVLSWVIPADYNAIQGTVDKNGVKNKEVHRAIIKWTWDSGTKTAYDYVDISIENHEGV